MRLPALGDKKRPLAACWEKARCISSVVLDGTFKHPPYKPRVGHPLLVIYCARLIGTVHGLVD
jgi:hypothetical protein